MLTSGKKFRASRDNKNKYSNSRVVRKKISEPNKKPYPPFKLNGRSLISLLRRKITTNLIFQKNSFNTLYFYALLFPRVVYISHSTIHNFHLKHFEWNSIPGITYFPKDLHSC